MNYNTLFPGQDGDLVSFVCRFLEEHGALAEPGDKRVDLLLPESLSSSLGVEEYISVAPGSDPGKSLGDRPLYPIHFGSSLLDKVAAMAGSNPPLLELSLSFNYIKKTGFDALIKEQFEFYKATGTVSGTGEIRTSYLILTCRYLAQSDEQKEGLVDLAVSMDSGAVVPGMVENLSAAEKKYNKNISQGYKKNDIDRLLKLSETYVSDAIDEDLFEFKKSMNRRFLRDASSLDDYYGALAHEMEESLDRAGMSDRLRQERKEKIALIPEELGAKQQDLLNKYSIRVKVSLAAVMAIVTPGIKVLFNAVSGKQKKSISLTYNPVTKLMDPVVCAVCGQSIYRIGFSKDFLLVCSSCQNNE